MVLDDPMSEGLQPMVFSPFRLDRSTGQLTRDGVPIPLRAKTWALLLYLIERPGVLLTRDELLDALWPGVAVMPDTLSKTISELRRALGDDSATPRYIETVHRRGVRFKAPVSEFQGQLSGFGNRPSEAIKPVAPDARHPTAQLFVGRETELRQLADLLAKASAGQRQIVFVTGPAGVGKTTLVDVFLNSPAVRSITPPVRLGRGSSLEQHGPREPYMPVLESLGQLAQQPDNRGLVELLRRIAPTWLAQMPWLIGDDAETLRRSLQAARAERMLREFASLIEAVTSDTTLVLVLEDLHWSDPSTMDLLTLLGQRREPARLLCIATYRPAEIIVQEHPLSQVVRTLQVRRQCVVLPVHELTEKDVRSYLQARFPGAQLPPELPPLLHQHTDGNPLFVVAVVEDMLSRGAILDTAPGWAFAATLHESVRAVPEDARRIIATQFERLGPADQSLLQAASVAGAEFVTRSVAAALGRTLDDVDACCEAMAHSRRFLRDAGIIELPDGTVARRFAFTHQLYRQAVYEETSAGRRQRLHQRIGEALETMHGERATELAAELAAHFELSRDLPRAVRYLTAAAARAAQRLAGREAISYLEAAIALAAQQPDEGERCRHELDLRCILAPLLGDFCGFASEELRQNCERAHALCQRVGSPAQLFEIVYALCHVYAVRADKNRMPALLQELEDIGRRVGTPQHQMLVETVLVRVIVHQARFTEVRRLVEGPLAVQLEATLSQQLAVCGVDPVIETRCTYAYALWSLGYPERARVTVHAALSAAARPGVAAFTKSGTLAWAAVVELLCRNVGGARQLADELVACTAENEFPYWRAFAWAVHGWARVCGGELHAGIAELERARAVQRETGAGLLSTHFLCWLAEGRMRAGETDAGLAAVDEGLLLTETTLDCSYRPELWRLKGELCLAQAGVERATPSLAKADDSKVQRAKARQDRLAAAGRADDCFRRALEAARETEARSLELRAATSLARLLHRNRKNSDARALLGEICQWFGPDATSPDLIDARALLRQLSPTAR
jgi:DNA-binding winged helix-turn-helix (wHTH) protein